MIEKIVKRRQELGISQEKIAKLLGVSKGTISNFENKRFGMNSNTLFKMLEILGMDVI